MNRDHFVPTLVAFVIGIAAVLLVLFAWHLPPFSSFSPTTENAYVRGSVTPLSPHLSGYIREVPVHDFQEVKKGDLIARIDDGIYRQKLAQAEAGLAAAHAALTVGEQGVISAQAIERSYQASLQAAQATFEVAKSKSARSHTLSKRGLTSQSDLDGVDLELRKNETALLQAEAQLEMQHEAVASAVSQLAARKAEIARAEAEVKLAGIDLTNTQIFAPEDGRLGQVSARVGQYVSPGVALVSHVAKEVWIIANFKETELGGLHENSSVSFTVDGLGGKKFTGRVEAFSPATASEFSVLSGSNVTGNFTKIAQRLSIRIAVDPDQDGVERMVPGMSVEVTVG